MALETIIDIGGHEAVESGLPLSAIMHPLGRVVLGVLFPLHYERMVEQCWRTEESLHEQERRILPMPHVEVLAQLLSTWQIPPDVALPLKHSKDSYSALARLPEPVKKKMMKIFT